MVKSNHPSFYERHGEDVSPAVLLVLESVRKGYGQLFRSRAEAESAVGACHPAPLGNVRKLNKSGTAWKNRVILGLIFNRANDLVRLRERVVLPRAVDHALDLACAARSGGDPTTLILDFADAFNQIPLRPELLLCRPR